MNREQTEARRRAMEVFYEQGWHTLALDELLTAPLGTKAQQALAKKGFTHGAVTALERHIDGTFTYERDTLPGRQQRLIIFAIRNGISAARAAEVAWHMTDDAASVIAQAVVERGDPFATTVVRRLSSAGNRFGVAEPTKFAGFSAAIAEQLRLPLTDNGEYLRDWVWAVAQATGADRQKPRGSTLSAFENPQERSSRRALVGLPEPELLEPRFDQLIEAAVAARVPADGALTKALSAGWQRGWITRDRAIDLAFTGLDSARTAGQRRAWLAFLLEDAEITDPELVARLEMLIGVFAAGDAAVARDFLARTISIAPDEALADLASVSALVPAKATRAAVLAAYAARPVPACSAEVLDVFAANLADADAKVARAAAKLVESWGGTDRETAPIAVPDSHTWRPTPALRQLARFEIPSGGLADLAALTGLLVQRDAGYVDIETERFLALANALARTDRDGVKATWSGIDQHWMRGIEYVRSWTTGRAPGAADLHWSPIRAREAVVFSKLGRLPVLLSMPTWEDLRIDPANLVERLREYASAGVPAEEGDLYLALLRTDPSLATPELIAAAQSLDVKISMAGRPIASHAGELVAAWLEDPLPDLPLRLHKGIWKLSKELRGSRALDPLPSRLDTDYSGPEELPWWTDAADLSLDDGRGTTSEFALRAAQRVRSGRVLSPFLSANLLYAASVMPEAAPAALEAFERGVLVPGVADAAMLNGEEEPRRLAAFASGAESLAQEGLLSVLWPLFDDVLVRSAAAPRAYTGTSEMLDFLVAHAVEAQAAVDAGIAPASVLELPGVRAFAAKAGAGRAPRAARMVLDKVGAQAPALVAAAETAIVLEPLSDRDFAEGWKAPDHPVIHIQDGATLTPVLVASGRAQDEIALNIELPGTSEVFQRTGEWWYDLGSEGQCAVARSDGSRAFLWWDREAQALAVSNFRNRFDSNDSSLSPGPGRGITPWTTTLAAAAMLLPAQSGSVGNYGATSLALMVTQELANSHTIRDAARALFVSDRIQPPRIARIVEKQPQTLGVLWPILTEALRVAAEQTPPPRWLARLVDTVIARAPHLAEATRRRIIPASEWEPLHALAAASGSSAGAKKACAAWQALRPVAEEAGM